MTAYSAMETVLDINETIEKLKEKNADIIPDLTICKAVDLLSQYRSSIIITMKSTNLGVFEDDGK